MIQQEDRTMERMIVVVLDNEKLAFEGTSALRQLELDGSLSIYACAVVVKHADDTVSVKQIDDELPFGGLAGTAVGSVIGLLGGPVGMTIGALSGLAVGAFYDLDTARVGVDFVEEVSESLSPNKVAIIAEIEEAWTTPVDTRMEALGGAVFRRTLRDVREKVQDEDVAAMEEDLAQIRSEIAKTHADRRAKLQKKGEQLQARIEELQQQATARRAAFEVHQKAKRAILKKNAAAAGTALKELATTPV
jgi:uncharacterized membrane protein